MLAVNVLGITISDYIWILNTGILNVWILNTWILNAWILNAWILNSIDWIRIG
jgi:hypothetical protein